MKTRRLFKLALATVIVMSFIVLNSGCESESPDDDIVAVAAASFPDYDIDQMKSGDDIPNTYIITLKDEGFSMSVDAVVADIQRSYGIPQTEIQQIYSAALKGFAVRITDEQLAALQLDKRVAAIEQDKVVNLEPYETKYSPEKSPNQLQSQSTDWGVTRVGGAGNGVGKVAWIIDTGIDLTHPDLTVDVGRSKSFLSGKDGKTANDGNGHGTHVAGTIAAKNNSIYTVGVAAGATVVAVRVLNSAGSGTTSGVIAGINYVAANGATGDY